MPKARFDELADQRWRILLEADDINEPSIQAVDPDRRGCFIGPLAVIPVGATTEDSDGIEMLETDSDDGLILAAVACLPQFAELFRWVRNAFGDAPRSPFVDELLDRVCWIEACIDDRDDALYPGQHGFESYRKQN